MKGIKEITKDVILAGLGTVDTQNEDIKDLMRRGQEVLGMGHVENEELRWNGNKDELDKKKAERETCVKGIEVTIEAERKVN